MQKKYRAIAGYRGLLVMMTAMCYHYQILFGEFPPVGEGIGSILFRIAFFWGGLAPSAFFTMSGFLLQERKHDAICDGSLGFGAYLVPKMKKIYPLMMVTTIFVAVTEHVAYGQLGYFPLHAQGGELRYSVGAVVLSILGLQSGWFSEGDTMAVNGPSWFVSCLFLCYVIYYGVLRLCGKHPKAENFCLALLLAVGVIFTIHPLSFPLLYQSSARGLWGFFSGVWLQKLTSSWDERKKRMGCIPVAFMAFGLGIWAWMGNDYSMFHWLMMAQCPFWLYLILYGRVVPAIFLFTPLVRLGDMSMSLFLGNVPLFTFLAWQNLTAGWKLDYGRWDVWFAILAASILTAAVTHLFFEKYLAARLRLPCKNKKNQ